MNQQNDPLLAGHSGDVPAPIPHAAHSMR